LQTFALYGKRFGGIEPHFKDYFSAAFEVLRSHLRDAQALTCLFMLLECASLIALVLGMMLVQLGQREWLDWHAMARLKFSATRFTGTSTVVLSRAAVAYLGAIPTRQPTCCLCF
jgi:hypothetical protein